MKNRINDNEIVSLVAAAAFVCRIHTMQAMYGWIPSRTCACGSPAVPVHRQTCVFQVVKRVCCMPAVLWPHNLQRDGTAAQLLS
jgi:hypothetical protein